MAIGYSGLGSIASDAGGSKVAGTSLTLTTTSAVPKGATVIVRHGFDSNAAGSATASAPAPGTLTCSVAGAVTGSTVRAQLNSGSASGAGVGVNIWTFVAGVIIPSGSTITVTVNASVTARAASAAWIGADYASVTTARAATGAASVAATPTAADQAAVATIVGEDNISQTFGAVTGWTVGAQDGTLGGNANTNVVIISARKIPVGATTAQTYNPSGTYAGGDWVASMLLFNDTSPRVDSLTPNSGADSAPQAVVIAGAYFTDVTDVQLNGVSLAYTVNSATQITATVPAGFAGGTHPLVVFARGSQSDGLGGGSPDSYTVIPSNATVVAPALAAPATVASPGVLRDEVLATPLIAAPAAVLSPSLTVGAVTVAALRLVTTTTLHLPTGAPGAAPPGTLTLLAAPATVLSPLTRTQTNVGTPSLLVASSTVHTPPMMWLAVNVTVVVPHIYV